MKSQVLSTVLAGAVLGSACGQVDLSSNESRSAEQTSQAIIGGTIVPAGRDPAVVSMALGYGGRYQSLCTGTLIGPKTVITAAHCIYANGTNSAYYAAFGTTVSSPTSTVRVVNQVKNPQYSGQNNDFGLLQLERPVVNVPIVRLNETPLTAAMVGLAVRHSGFGVTDGTTQTGSGTKREVTTPLRRIMSGSFESGAQGKQTCQGDSGGPAFMVLPGETEEKLVGTVSYGDQGCQQYGVDMRVDTAVSWIRQTMARWEEPTCEEDGLCKQGCPVIDQDCACMADGQCTASCNDFSRDPDCPANCGSDSICATADCPRPDADCVAEGGLCSAGTQCRGRQCVNDAQNTATYCSRRCVANADCVSNMECANGTCRIPARPERQLLESCSAMLDFCVASTCNGPTNGITRCVQACASPGDCPSGSNCEGGSMGGRYCRPSGVDFLPKTLPRNPVELGLTAAPCAAAPGGLLAGLVLMLPFLRRRRP